MKIFMKVIKDEENININIEHDFALVNVRKIIEKKNPKV